MQLFGPIEVQIRVWKEKSKEDEREVSALSSEDRTNLQLDVV